MELFLIIPLVLIAVTIALAPILALTVADYRKEVTSTASEPSRIPWNLGGPLPIDPPGGAPVLDDSGRNDRIRVG